MRTSNKEAICLKTANLSLKNTYFVHLVVLTARQHENALFHVLWSMFTNKGQQNFLQTLSKIGHDS